MAKLAEEAERYGGTLEPFLRPRIPLTLGYLLPNQCPSVRYPQGYLAV